jgi:hypothetical protein
MFRFHREGQILKPFENSRRGQCGSGAENRSKIGEEPNAKAGCALPPLCSKRNSRNSGNIGPLSTSRVSDGEA